MARVIDPKNKNIRICRRCGHFFEYRNIGYGLCQSCTVIDNEIFERVRTFIVNHGTATAEEISIACDVSEQVVIQYLRDGRIEIPNNSPIFIKCEICHADIRYGRLCQECAAKLQKSVSKGTTAVALYEVGERPTTGKMHTYDGGLQSH